MRWKALFTTPRGAENYAAEELRELGIRESRVRENEGLVIAERSEAGRLVGLLPFLRTVFRVVLLVREGRIPQDASGPEWAYGLARQVRWEEWFSPEKRFAVRARRLGQQDYRSRDLEARVGQAVIDAFLERQGKRPPVDLENPEIVVRVEVRREQFYLGLDLVGQEALHRRGYRVYDHPAALNTVLASCFLRAVGWKPGIPFLDPMCGGGTILIEAALRARGIPLSRWRGHWCARNLHLRETPFSPPAPLPTVLYGGDRSPKHLEGALRNAEKAGVAQDLRLFLRDASEWRTPGFPFVLSNPPYGVRSGSPRKARQAHRTLLELSTRILWKGGRLGIISPHGNWIREDARDLGYEVLLQKRVFFGNLPVFFFLLRR